jgi:hypothetical protein
MEARNQDFNADVNLLMPIEMWYLHHVKNGGHCDVHGPRLGDDL